MHQRQEAEQAPEEPIEEEEEEYVGIVQRDTTHDPVAKAWVEANLQRFTHALRQTGFQPSGIVTTTFPGDFGRCAPDEVPLDDDASEEQRVYAKAMDDLRSTANSVLHCWSWRHPETCDLASLEQNEKGDWLTFTRLYEDGRIVRTVRRPEGIAEGAPEATGLFLQAPLPGLHALMCRLGGDTFELGLTPKPGIGQFDRTTEPLSGLETLERHLAHVVDVGIAERAVPLSPALTVALNRRTLHVAESCMEQSSRIGHRWMFGGGLAGRVAAAGIAWLATGSATGLLAFFLARQVTGPLWGFSTGCNSIAPVLTGAALFAAFAWWVGLGAAGVAATLVVDALLFVSTRLIFFYLGQAGRPTLDLDITEPGIVPAADLLTVYGD